MSWEGRPPSPRTLTAKPSRTRWLRLDRVPGPRPVLGAVVVVLGRRRRRRVGGGRRRSLLRLRPARGGHAGRLGLRRVVGQTGSRPAGDAAARHVRRGLVHRRREVRVRGVLGQVGLGLLCALGLALARLGQRPERLARGLVGHRAAVVGRLAADRARLGGSGCLLGGRVHLRGRLALGIGRRDRRRRVGRRARRIVIRGLRRRCRRRGRFVAAARRQERGGLVPAEVRRGAHAGRCAADQQRLRGHALGGAPRGRQQGQRQLGHGQVAHRLGRLAAGERVRGHRVAPRQVSVPEWISQTVPGTARVAASAEAHRPVLGQRPAGVVGDLPRVAVGIAEDARVPAPERLAAGTRDRAAGGPRALEHRVDLAGRADEMRERHAAPAARVLVDSAVGRELAAAPEGEHHASGLEEGDVAVRRGALPAEPGVEVHRAAQVGHAERDQADALFHPGILSRRAAGHSPRR